MSVKIVDNTQKVRIESTQRVNLFLRFFMDEVEKHSNPITPKKEGKLRQSTIKVVTPSGMFLRGVMKWVKEYAAAQEVGQTQGRIIRNYTTPGTGRNYAKRGVQKAMTNVGVILKKARLT